MITGLLLILALAKALQKRTELAHMKKSKAKFICTVRGIPASSTKFKTPKTIAVIKEAIAIPTKTFPVIKRINAL